MPIPKDDILFEEKPNSFYISYDEFKELFTNAIIRGKDFPVFEIDNKEFAIARKERKIGL